MKKFAGVLLAGVMAVGLTACGQSEDTQKDTKETAAETRHRKVLRLNL